MMFKPWKSIFFHFMTFHDFPGGAGTLQCITTPPREILYTASFLAQAKKVTGTSNSEGFQKKFPIRFLVTRFTNAIS
jgi:hypothetical protein